MLDKFCKWWSVKNRLPQDAQLICLVSFGMRPDGYTNGLHEVVKIGHTLSQKYPEALICFGYFTGNQMRNPEVEEQTKCCEFQRDRVIPVGDVISTIEEAQKWWVEALERINLDDQKNIMIVTDEMHSRSARRAANRVWNGWWLKRAFAWTEGDFTNIHVVTFPTEYAIDPRGPMTALRDKKKWVIANVAREFFLMFIPFGYTIMKRLNIHQPIASK